MVQQSIPAQAREVDDLIEKLRNYRDKESEQGQAVKMASEKLKKEKATLEEIIVKKNKVIDELSGKTIYPLFEQAKKMEAEQDRIEGQPTESAQAEAPAEEQPTIAQSIILERVGETSEKVKLLLGERFVEIDLELIHTRFVDVDPDSYSTFNHLCDAAWNELQSVEQEELLNLFNEFAPTEEASNVVNFFTGETEQAEQTEQIEQVEQKESLLDESATNLEEKASATQEDWPEQILPLVKADGSLLLKLGGRVRKIDAVNVPSIPSELDLNDQDQLNQLWLSSKAYDWTASEDLAPAISPKKTRKSKSTTAEASI